MPTIQPKILEIPEAKLNGKKTSGEKNSKIWVYLARLSPFLEILILENDFGWMERAHVFHSIVRSVIGWKISRHFSQPINLITSFFPRLAPDANLHSEFSLVPFFLFLDPQQPLHSLYKVKPSS